MLEKEKQVLNLICSNGGGRNIHELTEATGMNYEELNKTVEVLIARGYRISRLQVGGWVQRFVLSPYDENYEKLMDNGGI